MRNIDALIGAATAAPAADAESRRRHPRRPAQTVVLIYWLDDLGLPCDACAVIRDASARGFGIETDQKFLIGQALTVRTSEHSLQCVVRHMQEGPNSYMAGLEVLSASGSNTIELSPAKRSSTITP